jgi:N-acetyl-gamma-glutamyl-phosphate reductase
MIKVGVIGATGYTGAELVRLLSAHPEARVVKATTENYQGQPLEQVYPHLRQFSSLVGEGVDISSLVRECDVLFMALPHGVPMELAGTVLSGGKKLIDLGADFRLKDTADYERWYKHAHTAPDLLVKAAYGQPETNRANLTGAALVANPGCYPTSVVLSAAPLLKSGIVETEGIIIDSKSGVSGAGRSATLGVHFSEVNENFKAYNISGTHRHTPEIEQELSRLAGTKILVSFTPHLAPMTRGILTTAYFRLNRALDTHQAVDLFRDFYNGEPFVRVRPDGDLPQTKQVWGSNFCDIGVQVDDRTGRITVISVIDNLVKGAAGQAIQNMNIIFGLDETVGLMNCPVYP